MDASHWIRAFHWGGLSTELTVLALSIVLGLVQLMAAASAVTRERGTAWNVGPRDEMMRPPSGVAGRLERAYRNFMETFPFFAAAILAVTAMGHENHASALGAELYLAARVLYVPLYALGIPVIRSIVWLIGTIGLLLVLAALVNPAFF